MKKKIAIVLLILMAIAIGIIVVTNPFQKMEQKREIKVGVCIYDQYDMHIAEIANSIVEKGKELERESGMTITVEVVSSSESQLTQNDQINRFIDNNYDVMCVNLVDRTDASSIIERAKNADVPVIFFNRELVEEDLKRWDKLYYVGAVAQLAGTLQGELIVDACNERFDEIDLNGDGILQYIVLEGEPGHQDALVRTQTSVDVVQEQYTLQKLGSEIANWDRAQAATKMLNLVDKYNQLIEVVIANDDNMALGAIDALKARNISKWPLIVGVNGMDEILEKIREKEVEGTVYNDGISQGYAIMDIAYALALDQNIPEEIEVVDDKYVYIPYEKIDYTNVLQYINK